MDFGLVEGISRETLGEGNAHCIYDFQGAIRCRDAIKKLTELKEGRLVFTNTYTKLKCGGAPKKICLLTEDYLHDNGARDRFDIQFFCNGAELMKPAIYGDRLVEIFDVRKIAVQYKHRLMSVDTAAQKAVFQIVDEPTTAVVAKAADTELITVEYDLLHFAPPMGAPDFVRNSPLAITEGSLKNGGWAAADKETLIQPKYPNIVVLGDVAGLPTSKTGAAIRIQAPIAAANLIALMEGKEPQEKYNGYSACPIVTEYGKVLMCEFGYEDELMPTIPWLDPAVERGMWWMVKAHGLKPMYYHGMLKGLV
jgi:sulfide:quinone oxidoreductase